eukprot:2393955-Rhodomonas_salina.2
MDGTRSADRASGQMGAGAVLLPSGEGQSTPQPVVQLVDAPVSSLKSIGRESRHHDDDDSRNLG